LNPGEDGGYKLPAALVHDRAKLRDAVRSALGETAQTRAAFEADALKALSSGDGKPTTAEFVQGLIDVAHDSITEYARVADELESLRSQLAGLREDEYDDPDDVAAIRRAKEREKSLAAAVMREL